MSKKVTRKNQVTPKQALALNTLVSGGTVPAAANAAGVSRKTIYKWLARAEFQAELNKAQSDAMEEINRALISLGLDAVDTLAVAMRDESNPPSIRIRAADIIFNRIAVITDLVDFENRLAALEKQAGMMP